MSGKILLVFRGEENDLHIRRVSISYIVRDNNGGSIPVRSAFHYRLALSHEPNITSVISSVHSVFPVPHAPLWGVILDFESGANTGVGGSAGVVRSTTEVDIGEIGG